MEYKIIKSASVFLFLSQVFLAGCWLAQNDGIIFKKRLLGQIFIIKLENSGNYQLVYQRNSNSYDLLVEACDEVYWDSVRSFFLIHQKIREINFYQKGKILNPTAATSFDAVFVSPIDSVEFYKSIFNARKVFLKKDLEMQR